MYLRFQSAIPDRDTGRPLGLFHAAGLAVRDPATPRFAVKMIEEHRDWFVRHLDEPTRFARSANPHAAGVALSWFRAGAVVHIERARDLAAILNEYAMPVTRVATAKPGYVVYSDEVQIAAIPYRNAF